MENSESFELDEDVNKPINDFEKQTRNLLASAMHSGDANNVAWLLAKMKDDDVTDLVRNDSLITRYLELEAESLENKDDHRSREIWKMNQNARALAMVVQEARKSIPNISLHGLLTASNFDLVVESVKALCHTDKGDDLNFAASFEYLLGHAVMVKSGSALRKNDETALKDSSEFQNLVCSEWNWRITAVTKNGKIPLETAEQNEISVTQDLVKFREFLCELLKVLCRRLPLFPSGSIRNHEWSRLCKVTLCRLLLLNKQSASEISDITISSFVNRPHWSDDSEK